jgi:pimeloyl-ACP methyl ester carboxylesterase
MYVHTQHKDAMKAPGSYPRDLVSALVASNLLSEATGYRLLANIVGKSCKHAEHLWRHHTPRSIFDRLSTTTISGMALGSVPYLVAGICILVTAVYLFARPTSVDNTNKQDPITYTKINESLHLARLRNQDSSSRQTIDFPDGRKLGYAFYGSTSAKAPTIIFIHGSGDNRLSAGFFHSAASDLSLRIISVDRPGYGLSSTRMGGKAGVLDFAQDVAHLTSSLKIEQYALIGVSGGGPFTLACAHVLPADQLKSVTMLVAAGPWKSTVMRHAKWFPWLFWTVINNSAVLRRWGAKAAMAKYGGMGCEEYVASNRKRMSSWWVRLLARPHEKDLAVFKDDALFEYSYDLLQENCKRADVEGMVEDWRVMTTEDLEFELEDVRRDLPVQLWYGRYDASVSWLVGEDLKKRLCGDDVQLYVREETHLGMLLTCRYELLTNLRGYMRR